MVIGEQFEGLGGYVIGGYLCGVAAREVGASAEVRLRRPLASHDDLVVERVGNRVVLTKTNEIVAEATPSEFTVDVPAAIAFEEAQHIAQTCPGLEIHAVPRCFCCGPARAEGDGLRIFMGWLAERGLAAGTWVPHRSFADAAGVVHSEVLWAALDCPALWSLMFAAPANSDMRVVTGTIAMHIKAPILADRRYVVLAWSMGGTGRTICAGAALYDGEGTPVAVAKQTCVLVERGLPLGRNTWSKMPRWR